MLKPKRMEIPKRSNSMESILIIGEDVEIVSVFEKSLKAREIHQETSRPMVAKQLRTKPPNLIVVDLDCPQTDVKWVSRIRQDGRYKHIPILLVSEKPDQQAVNSQLQLSGANELIFKPIDPAVLKSKIQHLLDSYRKGARTTPRYNVRWRADYHRLRSNDVLKPRDTKPRFAIFQTAAWRLF